MSQSRSLICVESDFPPSSSKPVPPTSNLLLSTTDTPNTANMSAHLTAVYTSPTATNTFSSPLSSAPTEASSSHEKSQYLAHLRDDVSQMQDDINQFLTKKMDEDKAATDAPVTSNDEDMEEQMYGEEVVDEA
ncbi:hypothetical protein D6D15_09108 [Aureobasidium pullulans]|uniref:EKC/KEOPS complex subunit GON7 n=1 Tax=Aureobasidium pullulans TaxID=5580 RepID=A0A4S9AWB5_AURPU|nr:hypothetical protein D6D15_09108 [Aureobasidium pullulans]